MSDNINEIPTPICPNCNYETSVSAGYFGVDLYCNTCDFEMPFADYVKGILTENAALKAQVAELSNNEANSLARIAKASEGLRAEYGDICWSIHSPTKDGQGWFWGDGRGGEAEAFTLDALVPLVEEVCENFIKLAKENEE